MLRENDFDIEPCLQNGPIAHQAQSVVAASRMLGTSRWASIVRTWCILYLVENKERIFGSGEEPVRAINQSLEALSQFLLAAASSGFGHLGGSEKNDHKASTGSSTDLKAVTGQYYGRLFQSFSSTSYWDEPVRLLRLRLERNEIPISGLQGKRVLDAGCGGGRYTVAWRLLGANPVTGVDISATGISDARRRADQAGISDVKFEQGNVLGLPYPENAFDVVFSNGVLHHTTDWKSGVAELVRVLKPGGLGWLYLIERPGGLFWDVNEVLRVIMRDQQRDLATTALQILGLPANRVFYLLDHIMVPINIRLTPDEIEACLLEAGAERIRRLSRGTDFDRIERIYQGEPFAQLKYGVGENRYVFSKG
jgi:ubiquinone/menaquinone biosynthesis C-methylase UbiE